MSEPGTPTNTRSIATVVVVATVAGDVQMSISLTESMYGNRQSLTEICYGPLRQSMRCVGSAGKPQELAIFFEQRATGTSIRMLNQLRLLIPQPAADASVALGGGPDDDPFILLSTVVAIVLSDLGFEMDSRRC